MKIEKSWPIKTLTVDLQRAAKRCKNKTFTQLDYANCGGRYSASTICRAFGGWRKAKIAAGLIIVPNTDKDTGNTITLTCLRCDQPFRSWDRKQNRLCDRCKKLDVWAILP